MTVKSSFDEIRINGSDLITSISTGGADNDSLPTKGYVDDASGSAFWNRITGTPNYLIPSTAADDIGATGARITKGWYTDLEVTNMPTVGGTSINSNSVLDLTSAEVSQLANIGSVTINNTQWGYLGASDQGMATTDDVQFERLVLQDNAASASLIVNSQLSSYIELNADTNDVGETNLPYIKMSQDGNEERLIFGGVGVSDQAPDGSAYTGTQTNTVLLGTKNGANLTIGVDGTVVAYFDENPGASESLFTIGGVLNDAVVRILGTQGSFAHGGKISFGDGDFVGIWEHADDQIRIHGEDELQLSAYQANISFGDYDFTGDTYTEVATLDVTNGNFATNGTVTANNAILDGGTNTFSITNGTASLDVAAGATVNVDANLTIESASTINQDVTTDASPTFAGATLSGLSDGIVKSATGVISGGNSVTLTSEVTGILPIANGGTNSSSALSNNRVIVSSGGAIIESATITTTELGLLNGIASVSTGTSDNDKFVTQGYVDDATPSVSDFVVGTYEGTGSNVAVSGFGFRPDLVEIFFVDGGGLSIWTHDDLDPAMQFHGDAGAAGATYNVTIDSNGFTATGAQVVANGETFFYKAMKS